MADLLVEFHKLLGCLSQLAFDRIPHDREPGILPGAEFVFQDPGDDRVFVFRDEDEPVLDFLLAHETEFKPGIDFLEAPDVSISDNIFCVDRKLEEFGKIYFTWSTFVFLAQPQQWVQQTIMVDVDAGFYCLLGVDKKCLVYDPTDLSE